MKTNILRYAVAALIASAATSLYAQEIYDGYGIYELGSNYSNAPTIYIGDESTVEINLPHIKSVCNNVWLSAPNVKSIILGYEDIYNMDGLIYMYDYGDMFSYTYNPSENKMTRLTNLVNFEMYNPGWCEFPLCSWWRYPYQLTFVPEGVGNKCVNLERVILPKRAQCIRDGFNGCVKLPTVTLPECLGYIGNGFNDCASLRDIRVRSGYVSEIEDSFSNLPEDAVIYVPKGFKETYENSAWGELGYTIAEDPDYDCGYTPDQLPKRGVTIISEGAEMPDVVLGMEHYHFERFDEDGDPLFFSDASHEIKDGLPLTITYIEDDNIYVVNLSDCYNIVEISDYALCGAEHCLISGVYHNDNAYYYLPETVEHIGAFVASYVSGNLFMTSLHEGVKTIGRKAFSNSNFADETISLPSTLESIGEGAFDRHSGDLKIIRCAAAVPPVCGDARVFGDKSRLELVVPEGSLGLYDNAPVWKAFSRITEDASLNSVEGIMADIDAAAEAEYYTLDGRRVAADALTPGIYVVRRGASVSKTLIR